MFASKEVSKPSAKGKATACLLGALCMAASLPATAQVNETLAGAQFGGASCRLAGGGYVVVWQSDQNGDSDVYYRLLDGSALPTGPETRGNVTTSGDQDAPAVCCTPSGGFVVAWRILGPGSNLGFVARRFPATGPAGAELPVPVATSSFIQDVPRLCCLPDGDFVVTWTDRTGLDGDGAGVFLRRFDGDTGGAEVQVNELGAGAQEQPRICCSASGGYSLLWADRPSPSSDFIPKLRLFSSDDMPLGSEQQIASAEGNRFDQCCDDAGNVRVVLEDTQTHRHLRSLTFTAGGAPDGPEEVVEEVPDIPTPFGSQTVIPVLPDVCCGADRDTFVVSWLELDYTQLPGVVYSRARAFEDSAALPMDYRSDGYFDVTDVVCTGDPARALLTAARSDTQDPPDVDARLVGFLSLLEIPTLGAAALALLASLLALAGAAQLRRRRAG